MSALQDIATLRSALERCMLSERAALERRLAGLQRRARRGLPVDRGLEEVRRGVEQSAARHERRRQAVPTPDYPEALPVSARRAAIAAAIEEHQVVVVAGETGSGKTTQLPKICLELGRGVSGSIAHTQPRRIAARSVAARIAEELARPLGTSVGYKVRFSDRVGPDTHIKLLTDGMLLAEVQSDPLLLQYDTVIIDEAHERSLNIDFLLGYLKQLLPRRPDLKLIVTSATINTEGFSQFFDGAPVIEVSGRTYPVEVRYRPLIGEDEDERDRDLQQAIVEAVDELGRLDARGDILIFLPGEREIRETSESLRKHRLPHTEVLPLYSRLSAGDQDKVFKPHAGRRIVLSTNVAETSLTVPGIRFVIDPGNARISRYSHRTKVQRLPIEAVSQASANQRAGRCGRVSAGVCIRLYAEEDFQSRPRFTDPEIRRTNLASVILQMSALGLGDVEAFPFMDPPDRRYINDGFRLLQELGAVDEGRRMTDIGRKLVRLPVDPRIGRMLLAADREGSLNEVTTIAAALAVQEPRERPAEAQQQADSAHGEFRDDESDFLSYLKLWDFYHQQARHLSRSKLRALCRSRYISYLRMREWHDIHGQLLAAARELGLRPNAEPAEYPAIHRAILSGLLSHVGMRLEPDKEPVPGKKRKRDDGKVYQGARGNKLTLFPGSGLYKKGPKWLMAAELVETSRLYARTVAAVKPEWLEELGAHLLKRSYSEPHWEKRPAQVAAFETVTLFGLVLVGRRRINYGPIDPELSRELFIREGLVEGEYSSGAPFFRHNRELVAEIEALEAKARRRDVLADPQVLFDFYQQRVPQGIYSGRAFEKWRRGAEKDDPKFLFLTREQLMRRQAEDVSAAQFPDHMRVDGLPLSLEYHFEPGHSADGVTVLLPLEAVDVVPAARFAWLVPGLLKEKLVALIRALPKALRRNFVPAPNFADACLDALPLYQGELSAALSLQLLRITGVEVPVDAWREDELPVHLRMNFRVVDPRGRALAEGRDLEALREQVTGKVRRQLAKGRAASRGDGEHPLKRLERDGLTDWGFETLETEVELRDGGLTLRGYPALVDEGKSVALRVLESSDAANSATAAGLRRLYMLRLNDKVKYLKKNLPGLQQMCLRYSPLGGCEQLKDDLVAAVFERVFLDGRPWPRDKASFEQRLQEGRDKLVEQGNRIAALVGETLVAYQQLARELRGNIPPFRLQVAAEIRQQLDEMLRPGFVLATPPQWLEHLPRYLQAAALRLEKHGRAPERERTHSRDLSRLWDAYQERIRGGEPEELRDFRWLLEELRVSLFAQELKTTQTVSVQRLEKMLRGK